jgi:hypothetical protein
MYPWVQQQHVSNVVLTLMTHQPHFYASIQNIVYNVHKVIFSGLGLSFGIGMSATLTPPAHQPHFYVFIQCIVCNFLSWLVVSDVDAGPSPTPDAQFID